ncbi:hypothetical protein D1871_02710 [Nakamurella silvestris]|nr:hypothetical protein D1871_02710 [Nakamurella silvestris]
MGTHIDVDDIPEVTEKASTKRRRQGGRRSRSRGLRTTLSNRRAQAVIGVVAVVAVVATVVIVQLPDSTGSTPAPVTASPSAAPTIAPGLLELGSAAQVSLPGGTVVSVTPGKAAWFADGEPVPADGQQYLVLDLTVTHVSGPPVDIAPSQLTVRWLSANIPNASPSAISGGHVETPAQFGPVDSTAGITGQVAFSLPPTDTVVLRLSDPDNVVLARWTVPAPQA